MLWVLWRIWTQSSRLSQQKSNQKREQKAKISAKRNRVLKETTKERDIGICQKSNVLIVVNMDILHEIIQKHVIMLIFQESEQSKKVKNMLDLDNISVRKECTTMCTEV